MRNGLRIVDCRSPIGGRRLPGVVAIAVLLSLPLRAQQPPSQTVQDEYAVYELLAPETNAFRTDYEVAVTSAGATKFYDRIGPGLQSVPAGIGGPDRVFDLMTGEPLQFEQRAGYLEVRLSRPVPPDGGQARLRIVKTYADAKSYYREGNQLVFSRAIGLRRAAFVLPAGFQLTECNVPSQILSDADGRIRVTFMNAGPDAVPLVIRAKPGAPIGEAARPRPLTTKRSWEAPPSQGPTERSRLSERAHQDRDIVYFLQQPETNAFSLYHDYTESREGVDKYLNVVRTGSVVSKPSAKILDTGEALKFDILTGAQMKAAGIDAGGDQVAPDQQVVVTHFAPVKKGQSVRLRLSETYTAPESYRLEGDEFVFERSLGRPRNSVVLPRGWYLTALSIPAVVRETPEGVRVDFVNGRPDSIDVLMKGKKLLR
jgi:hypothetical protein